jgi:hypothetical protein
MSAGNLVGAVMVTVIVGGLMMVVGKLIDLMTQALNSTIVNMAVYEDGVIGYNMMTGIFRVLGIIVIAVIWYNYFVNEASERSMEA